jgi:DNA-binding MarR family transcriptional regulator
MIITLTTDFQYCKLVVNMSSKTSGQLHAAIDAITQLTLAVFRLNGLLLRWGDEHVYPLGLTSARWQMLGALALSESPLTVPQLGEAMGVTRQGALKQINLLLDQGLVEAHANPAHRRSPLFSLTPQGLALYQQADDIWSAKAAELAAHIPPDQLHATLKTIDLLQSDLQFTKHLEGSS